MSRKEVKLYVPRAEFLEKPGMVAPFAAPALGAVIKEGGHNVEIVDANTRRVETEELVAAEWVFFMSVPTVLYGKALEKREEVRKQAKKLNVDAPKMAIGGSHASHFKESLQGWDFVCSGEGWHVAIPLVEGKIGSKFVDGGMISKEQLHELPPPVYELLENPTGYRRSEKHEPTLPFMSNIGCYRECAFCSPHFKIVRHYSPNQVGAMVRNIIDLGVHQGVDYADDFLQPNIDNKRWLQEICDELGPLDFTWRFSAHVNSILRKEVQDNNLLELIQAAGGKAVAIGGDGSSDKWLKYYRKGYKIDRLKRAIDSARRADLFVKLYQIFPPSGGIRVAKEIVRLIKDTKVEDAQVSGLVVLPGTDMDRNPDRYGLPAKHGTTYDPSQSYSQEYNGVSYCGKGGAPGDMSFYTTTDRLAMLYLRFWLKNWRKGKPEMPI